MNNVRTQEGRDALRRRYSIRSDPSGVEMPDALDFIEEQAKLYREAIEGWERAHQNCPKSDHTIVKRERLVEPPDGEAITFRCKCGMEWTTWV